MWVVLFPTGGLGVNVTQHVDLEYKLVKDQYCEPSLYCVSTFLALFWPTNKLQPDAQNLRLINGHFRPFLAIFLPTIFTELKFRQSFWGVKRSQGRRHTTTIGWAQVGWGTETFIAHAHTLHKGEILGESCSAIYLSRGARWGSAYEFSPRGCVDAWQTGGGGVYTGGRTVEASSSANQINIIISHYTLAIFCIL
mgnify:CR=1 FL=1